MDTDEHTAQSTPRVADPITKWETAVRAEADQHGGVLPPEEPGYLDPGRRLVRLEDGAVPLSSSDTETLLNGLIGDCRMLIRDIALQTARLTPDPDIRLRALASAQSLALAGARVGKTAAALKASQKAAVNETRYRMIIEDTRIEGRGGEGEGG
jgi:hypothetical protein